MVSSYTGRNPYFVLEPGYRLTLASGKDTLTLTVLAETKVVDGVRTRIVEERETASGKLAEISRNLQVRKIGPEILAVRQ